MDFNSNKKHRTAQKTKLLVSSTFASLLHRAGFRHVFVFSNIMPRHALTARPDKVFHRHLIVATETRKGKIQRKNARLLQ